MAFEDLRERLQSELKTSWDRLQESSIYIQLREKYENLSPAMQKAALFGSVAFVFLILFSVPMGYYSASSDAITEFEDKRQLIRDLLKVSREAQETPNLPLPPDTNSLKSQIDSQLQSARLLPEQIVSTDVLPQENLRTLPQNLSQGLVKVTLNQLNLRQILDVGHQIQSISPSIKMIGLQMEANAKDPRYFNVVYRLAVLAIPSPGDTAPEPEPPPRKRRGK